MSGLSHLDERGRAAMVDVGGKDETERVARAEAAVVMAAETLAIILDEAVSKGDVVATARLAGIMAAKRTHELIPLCHQLNLTAVAVDIEEDEQLPGLRITSEARLRGRTGVEMEALVAASVAALTVYDMCKAVDRGMEVTSVRLLEKSGGRSGHWRREDAGEPAASDDRATPPGPVPARVLEGGQVKVGDEARVEKASLIVAAILTVSDKGSRGERDDTSGDVLETALRAAGVASVERGIVPDEADEITAALRRWADETPVNLILTTGGTGMTSRDVTPEATLAVLERQAPGFAEAMRAGSLEKTPHAMLSRAVSGVRGRTLIINMPGSPRACGEQFAMISAALPHGVEKLLDLGGDCAPASPPGG